MVDIQEVRRLKQEAEEKMKQEDYQYFVDSLESEIDTRIIEAAKKGYSMVRFTISENCKFNSLNNLQNIIYEAYHAAGYVVNACLTNQYLEVHIYWSNPTERKEE